MPTHFPLRADTHGHYIGVYNPSLLMSQCVCLVAFMVCALNIRVVLQSSCSYPWRNKGREDAYCSLMPTDYKILPHCTSHPSNSQLLRARRLRLIGFVFSLYLLSICCSIHITQNSVQTCAFSKRYNDLYAMTNRCVSLPKSGTTAQFWGESFAECGVNHTVQPQNFQTCTFTKRPNESL